MGQCASSPMWATKPVNYNCPVCKETKKAPNIFGRFNNISDTECRCNGCNTVFPKEQQQEEQQEQQQEQPNNIA